MITLAFSPSFFLSLLMCTNSEITNPMNPINIMHIPIYTSGIAPFLCLIKSTIIDAGIAVTVPTLYITYIIIQRQ